MVDTEIRLIIFFAAKDGVHQMVKTEIRLIIFFAAKDGEALYNSKNKTRS